MERYGFVNFGGVRCHSLCTLIVTLQCSLLGFLLWRERFMYSFTERLFVEGILCV